jgi:serine/threonine-protein kinase haspin
MLLKNRKPEARKSAGLATRQPLAPCTPNRDIRKAVKSGKKRETVQVIPSAEEAYDKVSQLKQTLEDRLNAILELLDLEHGHKDMCCTADLVAFALDAQWLDERDFTFAK